MRAGRAPFCRAICLWLTPSIRRSTRLKLGMQDLSG
jgi:hypothetical protein